MKTLEIKNLKKTYWKQVVLDDININIEQGSIYGFIWPNGSGKTTTMKIISWLINHNSWEVLFHGEPWKMKHLESMWALIEKPILYENNTWYENLKIHALLTNTPTKRIIEVLDIVGLDEFAADKKTWHYSLGMKQRLGIGIAILHNPSFILLDEPTNGLDVEGIIAIRELLVELAKSWMTILVSSHNLPELGKACTHLWVIYKGKMLFEWSLGDYLKMWPDMEENYLKLITKK